MTWIEWIDSKYNTDDYAVGNYGIMGIGDMYIYGSDDNMVGVNDVIISGEEYTLS